MAKKLTPPFGVTGVWKLKKPFVVKPAKEYTCTAIRSYVELKIKNIDVYSICYRPLEIERSKYKEDIEASASLITLLATDGEIVHVPDTYIESYPDVGIGNFRRFILSCDLGALPSITNLSNIKSKVLETVHESLGRTPVVKVHIGSLVSDNLTPNELKREEANRKSKITDKTSPYGKLLEANRKMGDMQNLVKLLQIRVKENDTAIHDAEVLKDKNKVLMEDKQALSEELSDISVLLKQNEKERDALLEHITRLENQVAQLGATPVP